mmetsp:Transcript_10588/g.27726  ORF Transcript_10588/g.27726 Transcript_10588/m.27726 type:complete len:651 (-) Transcript_10588:253-2205(-)
MHSNGSIATDGNMVEYADAFRSSRAKLVGCVIDFGEGCISYTVDGIDCGIAFGKGAIHYPPDVQQIQSEQIRENHLLPTIGMRKFNRDLVHPDGAEIDLTKEELAEKFLALETKMREKLRTAATRSRGTPQVTGKKGKRTPLVKIEEVKQSEGRVENEKSEGKGDGNDGTDGSSDEKEGKSKEKGEGEVGKQSDGEGSDGEAKSEKADEKEVGEDGLRLINEGHDVQKNRPVSKGGEGVGNSHVTKGQDDEEHQTPASSRIPSREGTGKLTSARSYLDIENRMVDPSLKINFGMAAFHHPPELASPCDSFINEEVLAQQIRTFSTAGDNMSAQMKSKLKYDDEIMMNPGTKKAKLYGGLIGGMRMLTTPASVLGVHAANHMTYKGMAYYSYKKNPLKNMQREEDMKKQREEEVQKTREMARLLDEKAKAEREGRVFKPPPVSQAEVFLLGVRNLMLESKQKRRQQIERTLALHARMFARERSWSHFPPSQWQTQKAAATIQRVVRIFLMVKKRKKYVRAKFNLVNRIRFWVRRRLPFVRAKLNGAASHMQAVYRGFRARKLVRMSRALHVKPIRLMATTVMIQSVIRVWLAKRYLRKVREELEDEWGWAMDSIKKLQRFFRRKLQTKEAALLRFLHDDNFRSELLDDQDV